MGKRILKRTLSFFLMLTLAFSLIGPVSADHVSAAVTLKSSSIRNYVSAKVGQNYPNGYCLKFVEECYQNLGAVRPHSCCASKSGNLFIRSNSSSNIPIGATVYFGNCGGGPCRSCGSTYFGHVGIYVGDGYFVHATGGKVQKSTLSSWIKKYRGYGYCGNFNLDQDITSGGGQNLDADFSTNYAGNYIVTTSNYPLSMRQGPSASYSIITTIPKNATVYVEKANGSWAYVSYNGYKGYCSMEYLKRVSQTALPATNLQAWFSTSPMGSEVNSIRLNDTVYLCYRLETKDGKLLDSSLGNYTVKETIYFPNGSSFPCSYDKSNNNWIGASFSQWGTYRGVVEISGDYTGKVEISYTIAKPKEVLFDTWFSASKMGGEVSYMEKGKSYYLCYSIKCDNKAYLNKIANLDYKVTEEVYGPDGKKVYGYTYDKSDNNWIRFTATQSGSYKGIATIKGAFNASDTTTCNCKNLTVVQKPKLQDINITTLPKKILYTVGEKLDTTGMVVTARYSNGTTKKVTNYKVSGSTMKAGTSVVTVSYTEDGITKTESYKITVKEKETAKETMTVTYDPKGGTMSKTKQTGTKGSYITLLTEQPVKNIKVTFDANGGNTTPNSKSFRQKFKGWSYYTGSVNAIYSSGASFLLTKNCTLTAWYDDVMLDALPSVQKDGYRFDGWYTSDNVKAYVGMRLSVDTKLTAHWTKQSDDVLVNDDDSQTEYDERGWDSEISDDMELTI